MADEGAGSWNSGGGRHWGSGDYTGQQEGDFIRDRHRRDEWSDISDDEGPVVYADISRAGEYNYHVVQPQVQPVAGSGNERASRTDETPAGFSGFPWQQSVGWRHHQNVFPPYPSVPSGSMEYLPPSYPPGSGLRNMDCLPQSYMNRPLAYPPDSRLRSMDYLPQSYPPSLYHVAQRPDMSYLHHGGPMGEGEKRTNTSVAVTARNMAMDRRKDLSKSVGYQGSHLEGAPTSYPPALYQVAQKTETSFLHHGVIREGEKMKSNSVPRAERGIPVEKKEDVSKNAFFQGTYHERMPTSYPPALYPVPQKTDTPFLHGGLIREREKLKSNNVPKQDISQRKEDRSKNVIYQGSHLERTPTSYTPELYQVAKKTDTHFLHQGVIREGDKRKCNSVPVAEQSIPGEKKLKDLCSNNAIYQGSHLERTPTSYPPALYQVSQKTELSALNRGVIGEGEKLKKDNFPVPKQNLPAEQHEDPSKKIFYQGSHLEGRPTLYPPAIYQDSQFLHHGVIREGEKHKNKNISVPEQNISADGKVFYQWADLEGTSTSYSHAREGEKLKNKKKSVPEHNILAERTEDLSKNNVYQVSQMERIHASYPPALYQGTQTNEMSDSNRGVIAEGEKRTNNKEPVIELNIPEVRVEEPPKTAFWQGSQFEASQSVTRSLANEQAATQETLEMTRMGVSSQEELHPPDSTSSGQSLSDSNTAMIPHVGSGPTGVLPGAAFPLVPCHNEEKTFIPLKCLSQQRDGNIRALGGKEIEPPNISFKSEPSPAKPNENIRNTVQNLSKDCGEENRLDVPGKECPSIDGSNTVAHPSLTELHSLKNKDYAHLSVDAIGQTELSELEPSPRQPNRTGQHLLKELGEEKGSDVPAKDYPSIVRLKDTEHLSMPDLNTPKDKNHSQLSVDAIEATELSESGASPSGSDRTDENLLKECGEEKSSDVHSNNFSKPAEQPSLAEMDGPKEKECGEEKSPDVPGNDCPSIDCSKAAEYSPLAEMDNTKNEDLPQLSVDVIGETKLSESGRSPSRSDRIAHHLLKECGEEKSSDVHSNEGSKPAEHPSLAEMDSPKGKECGEEKSPDVPGNDCPSIDCSKAAEYSSLAEMDNTKNEDLPHLSVDVIGETKLSESGRSPYRSDRTDHNLLKECGEEKNSDVHSNEGSKPAEHPSLAEMDSPKGKECGEEKSPDVPGKDCPRIVCLKDAKYSSLAEMDNAKNEDVSHIGGDVLGELRLCKGEPYLPKSDQLQDVPGKGFPSTDSSEVMEHPPLSKIESVKDRDRDHAQSSVNVIGVLKKHKWKGGQRKKKKTLVKMAELLESTEERGQDTKDAGHTKIVQSGTQTQNVQLNYTNKKSHPSFPSPVKEFIYNFSLSPLSDHHTQNPKSHGSTALDILPINTSKPNVKSDLHKKQQNKAFPNVPQVDCLNQPIAIQGSEIASLQKEGNLTDDMTSTKQTSKLTPNKSIHSSKGSKKKNKVKQRKDFGKEADGKVRRQVNAAITQPPLSRKKGKRRKASRREENGLSLNSSSSVEQAPGRSDSTPQELNHSISQGHSTKVQSEVEVTAAVVRHKRTMKEGRKGAKTLKRGRKSPNDYGPSQRALTEDLFVKKDGANLTTSAPASTVPEQRKLQGKEKLPEDRQVTSPQKTQPILKGSGFKKPRLRTARSSAQDIALTVVTAEAAPKTSSPTTSKVRETMAPKEDVHLSIANASFEFAEEEFDIPVLKVTTKTDVPFEITRSDEKLSKVESPVSLEGSSNILSKLPGTEAQSTCIPTGAKPVTELSSKQQKQKSTLEQQSTDRCNEVEKQSEIGRKENKDQRHRCTEIKLEQALFALSAIKMGYPTVESSPSTNVSPSPVLKRKVGRPVKKKTLLRMAKTLNIVQEDTSCSTGNSSNHELIQEILPSKNPMQPPRTKKKLPAKPLVTPTRKSNRAVSSIKADVDYSSTSTVSIDTGHKGHADTCSVALHRLSDTMTIGQSFVNKVAQDSEEITGPETHEQDLQESTQVETKTVRAVKSKKKIKGRIKMARRKHIQQLAKVTSLPKDDLLPYNGGGDGKGTAIKPEEAEFALSAVDVGQLTDVLPSSSKHTNPSVRLKRKRGRPPSKKTLLREERQGIQEANSSSTENGGLTVEEIHEEKAQHHAQGQKKGGKNKPTVIPPRRSLRAFGAVREQGDRPSLRATSDHEEDTDMSCTRELSPDSKKTTPNETDEQDVEKVTTVRVIKRKKKALMPKKKKQGWRKLNEKLGRSKSSQENGQSPSHENGADVTEENCKITEIKPEQTESVPVSTGDTEYFEGLQQRSTNQSVLATVKRKVGRPLKKKTLLRMATLVKIVQKEKSRASANMTVDDNLERVLQEKRQQRQSSRIKKEKMTRPAITPERRSLRNTELGKMVKDRSFLDLSEGTDDEENTDTSSRQENTSVQDSEKATVSETDQHDHQQVPEESDTTVKRNLTKKRKRKSSKFTKKKMGKWKKSAQQLDRGISTQEEVDVDGASDGDSAPEDVDALEKVPSVPVSSKEEEEEEEEEVCAVLHSLQTSLEAQCIVLNQENDSAESHTEMPSKTIIRKSAREVTQKAARKRKPMPVVQAASEPSESQLEADVPKCPKVATTIKSSQPVLVAQVTTSKRSLRGPKSTAPSTVQKEQSQTPHNSAGTTESSKSLVDTKTEKHADDLVRDENKCKVPKKDSFENQFNDFAQSYNSPAIYVNVPGPVHSEQKTKRGRKQKWSSKATPTVELAEVSDPINNSDASPSVALTTSSHQSASNEQQNTLKKGDIKGKMVNIRKDDASHTVVADLKIHTQPKSRKNAHSYETPRRSSRASKMTFKFCHSEEYASSGGGRSLSPTEDSQGDVHSPDKTLKSYTAISDDPAEGRVVPVVSSETFEISTSTSITDKGLKPDLDISTSVDGEIIPKPEDCETLNASAEALNVNVEKKKRRRRVFGWDKRWDRRAQKLRRAAEKAEKYSQNPNGQNVDPSVIGRNGSFSKNRKTDDALFETLAEDSEDFNPADEMSLSDDVSNYSGCHMSSSPSTPSPPPLEDQKVDGGTQDCEEESKSQAPVPDIPNGTVPFPNKAQSAIVCKFCKRSFRHISAYTVHKRIHTGEKPYQCLECGKRFSQLSKLKSHRNEHKSQGSIQCPCCNKRFSKKEQLIIHFKVHLPNAEHPNKKGGRGTSPSKVSTRSKTSRAVSLRCSECSKTFPSKQKLQIHKRTHKDEQFPCKDCGKTFRKQSDLAAHERVHWPLKPYACSVCGKVFSKLKVLKAHSLEHTGETPFFCSHCGYTCSDLPTLRAHQASRICSTKKQDSVDGFLIQMGVDGQVNTPNLFKCNFCKKILSHWCQYTIHLQTHTKAQPYLCDSCGQSYERDSDVKVHCRACCKSSGEEKACGGPLSDIWNGLETDEIPQIPDEPQSPEHMDEECFPQSAYPDLPLASSPARSDVSILSSHPSLDCYVVSTYCPRTRSSHKRYECQYCGQRFRLSSVLRAHLQTHLPGNKYTCGLCGRVFQRWHKLWLHQRLHQQKGRSFSCSECNVQFHFLALYRQHLQEHAEKRPYACPLCPETFNNEASVSAHKSESHRLRRALKCDVCGKAFSSLRNWVRHSLLHNGRSSHSCLLCDQSFANNYALQDHLRIHNNDLRFPTAEIPSEPLLFPHQCWWCNVSFSTGELLYAHQICHAVGGKCLPCPPKAPPSAQAPSTITVTSTAPAPAPKQNQPSSAPAQSVSEDAPIPEIDEESLFDYAHPDSLYVVPDPIPPPPIPRHSLPRSKGRSSSQASSLALSQQTIVLDEEPPPRHSTETSSKAPKASPTVLDASSMQERNLPRTRSQKRMMEAMANLPQLQQTLSSKHKSKEGLKSFSITVTLQDSRGFECADCSKVLSSAKQLHTHYLKHAKGVLAKINV